MNLTNQTSWIALLALGALALGCGGSGNHPSSGAGGGGGSISIGSGGDATGAGHPGTGGDTTSTGATTSDGGGATTSSTGAGQSVRGVTNAQVLFEGTELDLGGQYGLYIQDPQGDIDVVADPLGTEGQVIHYTESKQADWAHVMVRPYDKRSGYQDAAQVKQYEKAYHYKQRVYVPDDPQYTKIGSFNLVEDFHCEPCEANSLQLMVGYDGDDSLCVWIAYSTDPDFDPRGLDRGSDFDPWPTISANTVFPHVAADGTATVQGNLAPSGALLICRDDLHVSDLQGRWVDFEAIVKPSSYDTGVVRMWIDEKPYFYLGANNYRWNQLGVSGESFPVNVFQIGLYGAPNHPASGTPNAWELFTAPPRIELGDDVLYVP